MRNLHLTYSDFTGEYIDRLTLLPYNTHRGHKLPPPKYIAWINNSNVTQITYTALYKHWELLANDSLQLCIYMTTSHILPANAWKCYQHYFQSRPIHSYPSMTSLVYYNYFHCSPLQTQLTMHETCIHIFIRCCCSSVITYEEQQQKQNYTVTTPIKTLINIWVVENWVIYVHEVCCCWCCCCC